MKITIEMRDDLCRELEILTKNDRCSIDAEIEKAVLVLTQKRALIRRLMSESCDEFDDAMRRLGD